MRLGFGFDIESTEGTCYILEELKEEEEKSYVTAFEGLTIMLPFIRILYGEFYDLDLSMLDN